MPRDPNPLRGPARAEGWAQLARLAGDRAAILLQALRQELGKLSGVQEELFQPGTESAWALRYRFGQEILFTIYVIPGSVEAELSGDQASENALPHATSLPDDVRQQTPGTSQKPAINRVPLRNRKDLRSLIELARKRLARARGGPGPHS